MCESEGGLSYYPRVDTFLGQVLADFSHFWPFLAIFDHFLVISPEMHKA